MRRPPPAAQGHSATLARISSTASISSPASCWSRRRGILAVALGCALGLTACGGNSPSHTAASTHRRPATPTASPARQPATKLVYRPLFTLGSAVQDAGGAALNGQSFVLMGGLGSADTSTASVIQASLHGQLRTAALPNAQHDAQAATLGGRAYLFGGGQFNQYDHILAYDPAANSVQQAGTLPAASSDAAVAAVGDRAFVVGGYDGVHWLNTIVAWRPGAPTQVVGHLPVALRYAAVTAAGGYVLIAGGTTQTGLSRSIYRFDPRSGAVTTLGHLPGAVTHAGAGVLGGLAYVIGGRGDSSSAQTSEIWSFDPLTGVVREAGRLPHPLSDATVIPINGGIVIAGGRTSAGTQSAVGELVPAG